LVWLRAEFTAAAKRNSSNNNSSHHRRQYNKSSRWADGTVGELTSPIDGLHTISWPPIEGLGFLASLPVSSKVERR